MVDRIDRILQREHLEPPIATVQHLKRVQDRAMLMFPNVKENRSRRFIRNQKRASHVKKIVYRVGDKVYLNYPSGRFRPIGGVTKFTKVNNGPYTVLADTFHGLVYRVKHDITGFVSNVSITRMIPAEARPQLEGAVRLPAQMDFLPGELPSVAEQAEQKDAPDSQPAGADRGANDEWSADMEISDEEGHVVEEEEEDRSAKKKETWITGRDTKKREEAEARRQQDRESNLQEIRRDSSAAQPTKVEPKPETSYKQIQALNPNEMRPTYLTTSDSRALRMLEREARKARVAAIRFSNGDSCVQEAWEWIRLAEFKERWKPKRPAKAAERQPYISPVLSVVLHTDLENENVNVERMKNVERMQDVERMQHVERMENVDNAQNVVGARGRTWTLGRQVRGEQSRSSWTAAA